MANKIHTPAYLIKRLRQSGFVVIRLFQKYVVGDPRKWSIMVDPGGASVQITCYGNYPEYKDISFEFNDGGVRWPKNFLLTTRSVEVIILELITKGVETFPKNNPFLAKDDKRR